MLTNKICDKCGTVFMPRIWSQRYCRPECNPVIKAQMTLVYKHCFECGKIFIANPSNTLLCGPCQRERKKRWGERFLSSIEYRWRREDLLRENGYQCQRCHRRIVNPSKFHLHHIVPISARGKDRKENIILVCIRCHWAIHRQLSTARNLVNP